MLGRNLSLKSVAFPKMLSDLKHANQLLKVFSTLALVILVFESIALTVLMNRSVKVVVLDLGAQKLEQSLIPKAEVEIEAALREYVRHRYSWSNKTVSEKLKMASRFIHPSVKSQYFSGVGKVERFAIDRSVHQAAYVDNIDVDLKAGVARVSGNRVTTIQGLRAAGELKLTLYFETSTRTIDNPWGVYVRQEKEDAL